MDPLTIIALLVFALMVVCWVVLPAGKSSSVSVAHEAPATLVTAQ